MCLNFKRDQGCSVKGSLDSCNLLIIDANVNSKETSFIVDTGATSNFIDKSYVENNLNKKQIQISDNKVLIPNSEFVSTTTVDLEFYLNDNTYNSTFIISDFLNQIEYLNEQFDSNKTICGILGNSFLIENNVIINYKTKKIVL